MKNYSGTGVNHQFSLKTARGLGTIIRFDEKRRGECVE